MLRLFLAFSKERNKKRGGENGDGRDRWGGETLLCLMKQKIRFGNIFQ